ncbi:MAG: acetyl-CoA carboxylase biotin carboxylase subunit [Rhodobacteraceae bacterium]|nr:MAG: acetyl-CoA carboxylase biotin carboxylase subunit [Paracoccaceae bacterium]
MFKKILIANRGEIALRVIRACKEMGITSVAVYSLPDVDSMHVRMADESICIGPASSIESYLSIPAIISACEISGADAIHPGYGFLAENSKFAQILSDHNITFIGPDPSHISQMGDKISAKKAMSELGVPCVPGSEGTVSSLEEAQNISNLIKFPVIVKASAGGGGRGMRIANNLSELPNAFNSSRLEAQSAFGNSDVYIEKYLGKPRHIEVQVFGDGLGNAVYLGERDCSLQRRHQKVLEESPSPLITKEVRSQIGEVCAAAMRKIKYKGAGTIEFLYSNKEFFFIEMNTRLQVEHPITESVYNVDLVREQIEIASGKPLSFSQKDLILQGHAIECRINAESLPKFVSHPGLVNTFHAPGGLGVRMDSILYSGYKVLPYYDSLVAKLIVHAPTRELAISRLKRALSELIIDGIETTAELFLILSNNEDFNNGDYDIHWLEEKLSNPNFLKKH